MSVYHKSYVQNHVLNYVPSPVLYCLTIRCQKNHVQNHVQIHLGNMCQTSTCTPMKIFLAPQHCTIITVASRQGSKPGSERRDIKSRQAGILNCHYRNLRESDNDHMLLIWQRQPCRGALGKWPIGGSTYPLGSHRQTRVPRRFGPLKRKPVDAFATPLPPTQCGAALARAVPRLALQTPHQAQKLHQACPHEESNSEASCQEHHQHIHDREGSTKTEVSLDETLGAHG